MMRRYLLTALTIGSAVAVVVLTLYLLGAFEAMVAWLGDQYTSLGIFSGEFLRIKWLEIPLIAIVAIGMAWWVIDVSRQFQKVLIALSGVSVLAGISPTFALYGFLVDPFAPLAAAMLSSVTALAYAGTEKGLRKRVLEEVLGPRVSSLTFNELLEAADPPDFKGASRDVTVLTCRIFNYEDLQNALEPSELLKVSNLFIRSVSTFLLSRGGYLDESSPELVRVSFGMLKTADDHASQACRAALELRNWLRNLSQECETRWFRPLSSGVGISSGRMTVGVYGAPGNFFYSGIGEVTDYSRRLALANLRYGSDLLVGPDTFRLVEGVMEVRPLEMYYDPASNHMTEIYQLLAATEQFTEEERRRRDLFWKGVIHLREKNFEASLDCFSRSKLPGSNDAPAAYLIGLSEEGVASPASSSNRLVRELTDEGHARLVSMM
jgi:class 3 adenylate cyclase